MWLLPVFLLLRHTLWRRSTIAVLLYALETLYSLDSAKLSI